MTTSPLTDTITKLVAPIVTGLKLDLYDLEYHGGLLRVTVDTLPGVNGGVTLDQLSLVNRLVGRELDHHDPIPGHYTLEVTSPGLERALRTPVHFQRAVGKAVSIRLRAAATPGERRLHGVLLAADDHAATVQIDGGQIDGGERVVPYDDIDRARTVFEWAKAPKLGAAKKGKGAAKATTSPTKGTAKPERGPSDELDLPIFQEVRP